MVELVTQTSFKHLFLQDTPFIDVRAEVEFVGGSFPGAHNMPILTSDERHDVGICYKKQGQAAAIELGHELVSGDVRAERTRAWCDFVRQHPGSHAFCWRGGMRSNLAAQWMAAAGSDVPIIEGGYKALRRYLMRVTESVAAELPLVIIGGRTGVAKTPLVQALATGVDLEHHANHRGSSFGRRVSPPPGQVDFEHRLAIDLLRRSELRDQRPLFLEDESRRVGAVSVPLELHEAMAVAPVALVEMPLSFRVERVLQEYVVEQRAEYEQSNPENGFAYYADSLLSSLERIRKRLGGERYAALNTIMEAALEAQAAGNTELHRQWIEPLLVEYYDPMYDYQMRHIKGRVVMQGSYDEVLAWAQSLEQAAHVRA